MLFKRTQSAYDFLTHHQKLQGCEKPCYHVFCWAFVANSVPISPPNTQHRLVPLRSVSVSVSGVRGETRSLRRRRAGLWPWERGDPSPGPRPPRFHASGFSAFSKLQEHFKCAFQIGGVITKFVPRPNRKPRHSAILPTTPTDWSICQSQTGRVWERLRIHIYFLTSRR